MAQAKVLDLTETTRKKIVSKETRLLRQRQQQKDRDIERLQAERERITRELDALTPS